MLIVLACGLYYRLYQEFIMVVCMTEYCQEIAINMYIHYLLYHCVLTADGMSLILTIQQTQ